MKHTYLYRRYSPSASLYVCAYVLLFVLILFYIQTKVEILEAAAKSEFIKKESFPASSSLPDPTKEELYKAKVDLFAIKAERDVLNTRELAQGIYNTYNYTCILQSFNSPILFISVHVPFMGCKLHDHVWL